MRESEVRLLNKVRRLIKSKGLTYRAASVRAGTYPRFLYFTKQKMAPRVDSLNRVLEPLGYQLDIVPIKYDLDAQHQPYNIRDK